MMWSQLGSGAAASAWSNCAPPRALNALGPSGDLAYNAGWRTRAGFNGQHGSSSRPKNEGIGAVQQMSAQQELGSP